MNILLNLLFKILNFILITIMIIIPVNSHIIKDNEISKNNNDNKIDEGSKIVEAVKILKEITTAKINEGNINTVLLDKIKQDIVGKNEDEWASFPSSKEYNLIKGVTTFRGNNYRDGGSYGYVDIEEGKLEILWDIKIGRIDIWSGVGWNGQPVIVNWPEDIKNAMDIKEDKKKKDDLKEVIYGTLDGNIYFLDLDDGDYTREPLKIPGPIKGSVAVDPRGLPLLYSGQGINVVNGKRVEIGYRIYNLLNRELLYFINGIDRDAYRGWGAFDSNPLIDSENDTLFIAGENGILYKVKLNTEYDINSNKISVSPKTVKYKYKIEGNNYQGIENSLAAYKNLGYFADNGGWIQGVDLNTLTPLWIQNVRDDTDSTIVIEEEDEGDISLYTACEVDKQGKKGISYIRKLDALTGKVIWVKEYICESILGDKPNNGGALATPVIGKNNLRDLIIFNLAREGGFSKGSLIALDKNTGEEVWKFQMDNYSWSSPVAVYTSEGKGYIIVANSGGVMYLIEGISGKVLDEISLGSNVEGSPAIYNDIIVVGTRGQKIFGIKIK